MDHIEFIQRMSAELHRAWDETYVTNYTQDIESITAARSLAMAVYRICSVNRDVTPITVMFGLFVESFAEILIEDERQLHE